MCMMKTINHLFFYFAFMLITTVLSDEIDESCIKMFNPEFLEEECCETIFEGDDDTEENFEGCSDDDDSEVGKCDSMKCYLKNLGVWKDDGINNEAAKKRLESMELKYPKSKKTSQRISKQCLDKKYLQYGTDDVCPAMKYFVCSYVNTLLECDSWKKTDQCSKNSQYASKCKAFLDSQK